MSQGASNAGEESRVGEPDAASPGISVSIDPGRGKGWVLIYLDQKRLMSEQFDRRDKAGPPFEISLIKVAGGRHELLVSLATTSPKELAGQAKFQRPIDLRPGLTRISCRLGRPGEIDCAIRAAAAARPMSAEDEKLYSNPFVLHLRAALDSFLAGKTDGIEAPAIEARGSVGNMAGLKSFPRDLYSSRFIIIAIEDAIPGGKNVCIVFHANVNRTFTAWIYGYADGGRYVLRGFWEDKKWSAALPAIRAKFGTLFADSNYGR
jgi:hypothetical protein